MGSETYFYCAWQPEDGWKIRKETFPFDQPKYTFFFWDLGSDLLKAAGLTLTISGKLIFSKPSKGTGNRSLG